MESSCTKKLIRSKSGLRIVTADENLGSPFHLNEPQWTPDKDIKQCSDCNTKFDFLRRKHHCRRCGRIYCGSCCDTRVGLPRMCFVDPVRVCEKCAAITNKEKDFFDHQLKTLTNGATFLIHTIDTNSESVVCRLSSDHRYLIFDGASTKNLDPVELTRIKSVGLSRDENSDDLEDDTQGISSVEIVYAYDELNSRKLKLLSSPEPHGRTSSAWIAALHQVTPHQRQWSRCFDELVMVFFRQTSPEEDQDKIAETSAP